jgi:CysZ protein
VGALLGAGVFSVTPLEAVGCRIVAHAPGESVSAPRAGGGEFLHGVRLLGRGFGVYARSPKMLLLGLVPAVISLGLVVGALILLFVYIDSVGTALTWFAADWPKGGRQAVRLVAEVAIVVIAVFVAVFTYTALTLIIGDPFYEVISKGVDERAAGRGVASGPGGARLVHVEIPWYRSLRWNLVDSLRLLALSVSVSVPLFLLGFVPVVGQTVVPVLDAIVGGWLLAVELTGIPFNRRGLRLRDRRRALRAHRGLALGFGIPVFLMMLVPFLGVLVVPAAVAGGTLLTHRVLGTPS